MCNGLAQRVHMCTRASLRVYMCTFVLLCVHMCTSALVSVLRWVRFGDFDVGPVSSKPSFPPMRLSPDPARFSVAQVPFSMSFPPLARSAVVTILKCCSRCGRRLMQRSHCATEGRKIGWLQHVFSAVTSFRLSWTSARSIYSDRQPNTPRVAYH